MTRRVNHRGWIVLESILSEDRTFCVDLFEDPAGGFGFEHLRADPEDGGRWTAVGGFSAARYGTAIEAATHAHSSVQWLGKGAAAMALGSWLSELKSGDG